MEKMCVFTSNSLNGNALHLQSALPFHSQTFDVNTSSLFIGDNPGPSGWLPIIGYDP